MAMVDFQVARISSLMLPQSSQLTCWAACATGLKAVKKGKMLQETDVLPEPYLTAFNSQQSLGLTRINDCYQALGFKKATLDLSSRQKFADFVKANAPIIVSSSLVQTTASGATQHLSYHLRLVYGVWGQTDSANEDEFQVRIYDPWPAQGFKVMQGYLFSHFKYQMNYNSGNVAGAVGLAWHN